MSILLALLRKNWAALVGAALAIIGVVFGVFRDQQAKVATAEAERKVAEKTAAVAEGNAAARQAETKAVTNAATVEKQVAATPDSELDKLGAELGILRDDK